MASWASERKVSMLRFRLMVDADWLCVRGLSCPLTGCPVSVEWSQMKGNCYSAVGRYGSMVGKGCSVVGRCDSVVGKHGSMVGKDCSVRGIDSLVCWNHGSAVERD